jgi:hypothetical protein
MKKKTKTPKSHWNYRVLRHKDDIFAIHEVYYEDGKPNSCSENSIIPFADTVKDLKEEMKLMSAALKKKPLNYEDF